MQRLDADRKKKHNKTAERRMCEGKENKFNVQHNICI